MTEYGTYRKALDKRIKAGRVFLNNKTHKVTHYEETDSKAIVKVDGKDRILGSNDKLIIT